ncbi:MAG: carbon-nitrogen hydrolase family protein [Chloroflexi bacterium]|nr:MAG: carbon-nitrogen hydrolase family protein [Chloroflexota bacterium]RLT32102.1 MAG: carbon-nitrogen hydrolase family protein [Chloroflexota bacterium]
MTTPFRAACLQMNSCSDLSANLAQLKQLLIEAAGNGAQFVLSPEYCLMMDGSGRVMRDGALPADGGTTLAELRQLAVQLNIWLLAGSLTLKTDEERIVNRSYLIAADGTVVATYDKIHMFDVTLPDGKVIRESSAYRPGEKAVIAATPWGKLGMTICYDVRFPHLYRALAQQGAEFLSVPSSFQRQTGKVHWHTLLKSRAIENAAYVLAPAMCGDHPGNRQTYGHALIVDPWGEVLADAGEEPGIIYADIDPARVAKIRGMMPSLQHDRPYAVADNKVK